MNGKPTKEQSERIRQHHKDMAQAVLDETAALVDLHDLLAKTVESLSTAKDSEYDTVRVITDFLCVRIIGDLEKAIEMINVQILGMDPI